MTEFRDDVSDPELRIFVFKNGQRILQVTWEGEVVEVERTSAGKIVLRKNHTTLT